MTKDVSKMGWLGVVFAASVAFAQNPPPNLKELCRTVEGRKTLRAQYDPLSIGDMIEQAKALNVDPEQHIRSKLDSLCSIMGVELTSPVAPDAGETHTDVSTQEQRWPIDFSKANWVEMPNGVAWKALKCPSGCKDQVTLELPPDFAHSQQVCTLSFKSTHKSDQRHSNRKVGVSMVIKPTRFVAGPSPSAFQGLSIQTEAGDASSLELNDITLLTVPLSTSSTERAERGCILPNNKTEWKVGQAECTEDRKSDRHSDQCSFTHLAEDSRIEIRRRMMRKIRVSKPANSDGEEVVRLLIHGSEVKEHVLRPGQTIDLLSKSGQTYTDAEVRIVTSKLGAKSQSKIDVMVEWFRL